MTPRRLRHQLQHKRRVYRGLLARVEIAEALDFIIEARPYFLNGRFVLVRLILGGSHNQNVAQSSCYGIAMIKSWYYDYRMTRADTRELECFVAVADHLNFSKAAKQLYLSQPPLTRHIQVLEKKLQARLFERNTHAVSLTEAGALFLEDARTILSHLDRANETIRRAGQGETMRLRLAFIGALLDEKLVLLIQRFLALHPQCQMQISDLSPSAQLAAIKVGEVDGGFIGAQPVRPTKDIASIVWHSEPLLLALPENHALAKIRTLKWTHLKNLAWVMVSRREATAFRQQFDELGKKHDLSARIVQESDRLPAVLTMVATGGGVTLVPSAVGRVRISGIIFRKPPSPEIRIYHAFAYRSQNHSRALLDFISLLRK
jgi:DNA-binding transcriptional LysR family regulator